MRRNLGWIALLCVAAMTFAVSPLLASSDDDEQKGKSALVLPANPPDADAKGKIEIEHHTKKYEEKFEVEAENLPAGQVFEVFLEDQPGSGNLVSIGKMASSSDDDGDDDHGNDDGSDDDGSDDDSSDDDFSSSSGEYKLVFKTKKGDTLPFGVTYVSELSGRHLEVRSGGVVYLQGVVPQLGQGGGSSGGSSWVKVQNYLVRPDPAPDGDAKGKVEIGKKTDGSNQKFEVEAEHLDVQSLVYSVYLETGAGTGVLQDVGTMLVDGSDEVKLDIETEHGQTLPFGVTDVAQLSGRTIEVRGSDGLTYLTGIVPSFSTSTASGSSDLVGVGKGRVRAKIAQKKKALVQSFTIEARKQGKKETLVVWMRNPKTAAFEPVATVVTSKSGKAKYKVKTKKGQPLPFGVPLLTDLSGLEVQIRTIDGQIRLEGQVPNL